MKRGRVGGRPWRPEFAAAGVLLALALLAGLAVGHGWPAGMALEAAARFGGWVLRGGVAVACLLGLGALRPLRAAGAAGSGPIERIASAFLSGWAVLVVVAVPLLALGWFTCAVWMVLAAAGAVGAAVAAVRWLRFPRPAEGSRRPGATAWKCVAAVLLLATVWMASVPPESRDELTYHLVLPQQWALSGSWEVPPGNPHLFFPANGEVLFSWAGTLAGRGGPRFAALIAGLLVLGVLVESAGGGWTAWSALVFLLAAPVVPSSLAVAYVDWPLALALLLGWRFFRPGRDRPGVGGAIPWGLALGTKYTAVPLVAAMAAERLWRERGGGWRLAARPVAGLLAATVLLAAPWFVRNAVATGDPVHPFGSLVTRGASGDEDAEAIARFAGIEGPMRVVPLLAHALSDPRIDEHVHPLWPLLLLGVAAVGWRRPEGPWLAVAAGLLAFMVYSPSARIALPVLVLSWLWLPGLLGWIGERPAGRIVWGVGLVFLLVLEVPLLVGQWVLVDGGSAMAYLAGQVSARTMLERCGVLTPVVARVAAELPPDARLWVWGQDEVYWFGRWTWSDSPYRIPEAFRLAREGPEALDRAVRRWGITAVVIDRRRVPDGFGMVKLADGRTRPVSGSVRRVIREWLAVRTRPVARDGRYALYRIVRGASPVPAPRASAPPP